MASSKAKQISMRGGNWLGETSGAGRMENEDIPVCIGRVMKLVADGAANGNAIV